MVMMIIIIIIIIIIITIIIITVNVKQSFNLTCPSQNPTMQRRARSSIDERQKTVNNSFTQRKQEAKEYMDNTYKQKL